jgi:hypothetical protein
MVQKMGYGEVKVSTGVIGEGEDARRWDRERCPQMW